MDCVFIGTTGLRVVDFSASVKAVAERLGRSATFVDESGYHDEIVAAAVDATGERFAWLQCRSKDLGEYVDVSFRLNARDGERTLIDWEPKSYNPFFGVNPRVLEWTEQGGLVFVYSEKHHVYRATFDREGSTALEREVANDLFIPEAQAQREDEQRYALHQQRQLAHERRRQRWAYFLVALLALAYLVGFILFDQLSGNAQRQ